MAVSRDAFDLLLERYGRYILRMKGWIDFGEGLLRFEKVGDELTFQPETATVRNRNGFVLIAWQLDRDILYRKLVTLPSPADSAVPTDHAARSPRSGKGLRRFGRMRASV